MKHKPVKPRAKALHQPCKELAAALAMPERKRRKGANEESRRWSGRAQGSPVLD